MRMATTAYFGLGIDGCGAAYRRNMSWAITLVLFVAFQVIYIITCGRSPIALYLQPMQQNTLYIGNQGCQPLETLLVDVFQKWISHP